MAILLWLAWQQLSAENNNLWFQSIFSGFLWADQFLWWSVCPVKELITTARPNQDSWHLVILFHIRCILEIILKAVRLLQKTGMVWDIYMLLSWRIKWEQKKQEIKCKFSDFSRLCCLSGKNCNIWLSIWKIDIFL